MPASMPAACKLKPVRSDAPPWLKHNPEVSSERSFIDGFVKEALPSAPSHGSAPPVASASHVESALYVVYEEGGAQTGLFAFGFASRDMASFASELFQRSSPKDPDRFVLEQREDVLIVQWTDGKKGPCWEALSAHRTKSAKP
jgi:hypothetical protein